MVTSGFFNSLDGDRKYNADQMSAIFDGIINDGVYASIGTSFGVKADTDYNITVGIGRAWFNSTWLYNDSILPLTADISELLLDRYDAVIIEIDRTESVRKGSIKIVKGTPSTNPEYPTLVNAAGVYQYPLAYIYREAGSTEITQSNIINMIGTSSCPYVTGIIQSLSIDNVVAQWEAMWNEWYAAKTAEMDEWTEDKQTEIDAWYNAQVKEMAAWIAAKQVEWTQWYNNLAAEMESWTETEKNEWYEWRNALESEMTLWTTTKKSEWTQWFDDTAAETEAWTTEKKAAFDEWFAEIRDLISTDSMGEITDRLLKLEDGTTPAGKATEADNALALGGKTASAWQTKLDNIQTTSNATLSTAGWYRVAECGVSGISASAFTLDLIRGSGNYGPEIRSISANVGSSWDFFSTGNTSIQFITMLRITKDSSKSYAEIYFNASTSYMLTVICESVAFNLDAKRIWQAITPTLTEETVDGVTVTTTYDIPANASPVTDLDIAEAMSGYVLPESGTVVSDDELLTLLKSLHDNAKDGETYTCKIVLGYVNSLFSGGVKIIRGFKQTSNYGYQFLEAWAGKCLGVRVKNAGTWYDWQTFATTSDLTTALAGYLKNTGGDVSGTIKQIISTDAAIEHNIRNSLRNIGIVITADGRFAIYDNTNGKNLMISELNGTTTFNGTATGNLPLTDGGTITSIGGPYVKFISTATPNTYGKLLKMGDGMRVGLYGTDASFSNELVLGNDTSNEHTLLRLLLDESEFREILHTGNYADYAQRKDDKRYLLDYLSDFSEETDIRSVMYKVPSGVYTYATGGLANLVTPFDDGVGMIIEWERTLHKVSNIYYGSLTIKNMTNNSQWVTCSIYNNYSYTDWKSFLPLDGSVPMTGTLSVSGGYGRFLATSQYAQITASEATGNTNDCRGVLVRTSLAVADVTDALQFFDKADGGTSTYYKIHHDGNSATVKIQESAPTDTSALWVW